MAEHVPVLVREVLQAFAGLAPGALVVDGTCGFGGHAAALLDRYPELRILGLDRDEAALVAAAERLSRFGGRARVQHSRFSRWHEQLQALGLGRAQGLILDLGVSSAQLDRAERGFSFRQPGPIDMRMDPAAGISALQFLEGAPEDEIADVIWRYGEERHSRRIAREIKRAIGEGRLSTTSDLAAICRRALRGPQGAQRSSKGAYPGGNQRIDPATRTFQALRIHVNDELGELEQALAAVPLGMDERGVIVVISFHSLEDRIVKHTFRDWQRQDRGRILKPEPITADEAERAENPRARSAKMRVFAWGEAARGREGADKYRSKRHR